MGNRKTFWTRDVLEMKDCRIDDQQQQHTHAAKADQGSLGDVGVGGQAGGRLTG